MFSNLQNKIDLKKIKEDKIEIDTEFVFKEDFDIVNQTITYFQKKKDKINNIIIKEEVTEYEDEDIFDFLEKTVEDEQEYIYNDDAMLDDIKNKVVSDEEESYDVINENHAIYHKKRGFLPLLMEEANEELKTELDKYRMADGDWESFNKNEYDVEALFDKDVLDLARKEQLNQIYTVDWLSKQLVEYRKTMNDSHGLSPVFEIQNNLKSLDVNDPDEIKNKIKDLNESIAFLKSKKLIKEGV
jgi:hypothetical protein